MTYNLKLLSIAGGIILALLIGTYFYASTKTEARVNAEWEVKIATAPVRRDTVVETKYIELPARVETVRAVPRRITRAYQLRIDSAIAAADSLEQMLAELLYVQASFCYDSIMGAVSVTYYPFEREFVCNWNPNPIPVREVFITETREILVGRPWYEAPAYIGAGILGGWLLGTQVMGDR